MPHSIANRSKQSAASLKLDDVLTWLFAIVFAIVLAIAVGNIAAYIRILVARYTERQ